MKLLLRAMFVLLAMTSYGQQSTEVNLFAQGMFEIPSVPEVQELQNELRLHPNLQVVRLDHNSNRFFILTVGLEELPEETLRSWFGDFGDNLDCIQIGVHGVDVVRPYPFENCPH